LNSGGLIKAVLGTVICLCLLNVNLHARESVRVLLVPFEVHSEEELNYLALEIPKILEQYLKQAGAAAALLDIEAETLNRIEAEGAEELRNLGLKEGADYILGGSFTRIGKQFSLDTYLLASTGDKPADNLFVEGEGMEDLLSSIKKLGDALELKLFKRERVVSVKVVGNQRIELDAINQKIKTKPGDIFLAKSLSEDLKAVYAMGYFEDIRIESEDGPDGKRIVFRVQEKPTVRHIKFKGNHVFDDKELKENLSISTGAILNLFQIQKNIGRIEDLYKDKNYHNVAVTYAVKTLDNNQGDLTFSIEEGKKVKIKTIDFDGNTVHDDKKLKKLIKSSEKGMFSWVTGSGELDREALQQDVARLTAFYHNSGYIRARIGEPLVEFRDDWIYITIKVDEGPRFTVGRVDVSGDLISPEPTLLSMLKISQEAFYNREIVRNDILRLTDAYSDEGYAFADIYPRTDTDEENFKVDITYNINKGKQVFFERINITGNTKTRDKVIRRELRVYEQELYSGSRLKRGVRNLYRLDFFGNVEVDTAKGGADDKMILNINVEEKSTGSFSFGGGYSTTENAYVVASISQMNLFGRGQTLELRGQIGSRTNTYTLSFTEPWLFDIPLSAGFDIYNQLRDYDDYEKDSLGGGVRFSYPVWDWTRLYLRFNYDRSDVFNILESASESIQELEGINTTASVTTSLVFDSRDRLFNTTEGSSHRLSVQYAGFGGNIAFTKYLAEAGWYLPIFWGMTQFLHAEGGYVRENAGGILPDYERFYLGGSGSVRGFGYRDIFVLDENGDPIGGDKFIQFNFEILIPLLKDQGLVGVAFIDAGNVYGENESIDVTNMRHSAGYGFRWYSPIGPIRLEAGYILNPRGDEAPGANWEFGMGAAW
jgi:outer membrane protein insertion porin family